MSSKPENTYITGVHKKLDKRVYREKMANPYRGGTPDVYYEEEHVLWTEYKRLAALPARDSTMIVPGCSKLQLDWLERNWQFDHEPWVIVGSPHGGVILTVPLQWANGITTKAFKERMMDKEQIAARIYDRVCSEP